MKDTTIKSIIAVAMVAAEVTAFAQVRHWRGTSSSLASAAENWAESAVPAAGDSIILDADSGSRPLTWDLDISLSSWTQTPDYSGAVTFCTGRAEDATTHGVTSADGKTKELRITGNVVLAGGTWTTPEQPSFYDAYWNGDDIPAWKDGNGVYRLVARIGGAMTVAADASIDVTGKGFLCYEGPGSGSHAGYAGYWVDPCDYSGTNTTARDCTYGSIKKPVTIGSGGDEYSGAGGGGIELEVTGFAMINGALLADGVGTGHEDDSCSSGQPGAGGAVWLKAAALKGAGTISASHGYVMYTGGSGGRISVVLTGEGETFSSWAGRFRTTDAYADWDAWIYNYPTAGTIYLEEAGLDGVGDLIIKDGTTYDADNVYWENLEDGRLYFQTPMTPDAPEDTHFRDISLLNGAILGLPSNAVLKVDRALITDPREMDEWEELYFYQIDHVVFDGGEIHLPAEASIPNVTIHVQAPGSVVKAGDGTGTFSFMPNNECKFDYGMVVDGNASVGEGVSFSLGGPLTVNGNMTVAQGAYLSMPYAGKNTYDASSADLGYRLAVTVAGDFTVAAGGFVSADYAGYYKCWSPSGYLANVADGGSYGGLAAHASGEQGVYGSVTEPTDLGAGGGGGYGGGVVRLAVGGTCTVNGTVSANGLNASTGGAGSGGSIWITCGQLVGGAAAIIRANGGNCNDTKATARSHGGGGRIAIHLTGAGDFSQYLGQIQACGGFVSVSGARQGGAGTVYLKKLDGSSTLVVDNGAAATYPNRAATSSPTPLTAEMMAQAFGDVTVRNTAWLCPEAGCSLQVAGALTAENAAPETIGEKGSSVTLVDASKESVLTGRWSFQNLLCETPGKSIVLDAATGSEVSVATGGKLYLAGDAQSPVVFGNSTAQGKFTLPNGAVAEVRHATIAGVDSSGGVGVVADNSCALGERVVNWSLADMTPGENTWTGAQSSDWSDGRNWSRGRPPMEGDTITISAGVDAVLAGDVVISGLAVNVLSVLDMGGHELTVNGDIAINDASGLQNASNSKLTVGGANVTAALNGTKFGAVKVAAGKVAFTQAFSADSFEANAPDCTELAFAAGETYTIGTFKVNGTVNGAAAMTLKSTVAGTPWTLEVGSMAEVSGAVVSDSTAKASDSFLVVGRHPSVDGGNNKGWTFGKPVATTVIPASAYIQDGLIAMYDAIENAGPGLHDATPEKWINLAEGSDDIPLKAGYHVFGDQSLVLKRDRIAGANLPGVRNSSTFTYEAYTKMNSMAGGANDMPCLTAGTKGGIGHDTRPENGFCAYAVSGSNWGTQKANYGWFSKRYRSIDIAYAYHTLSASGSATGYLDGEKLARSGSWTAASGSAMPDGNVYIGHASVEYEFGCARVYSRALTDNESMINANIDKMRFQGADPDKLTWPEEYRWRDGKLMRRVLVECDSRYGTVSVDGGEPQSGLIELMFEAQPGSSASTSVTLTATPTARSTGFRTWQGNGTSYPRTNETVTLTVTLDPKANAYNSAKKVEALFNADDIHYVGSGTGVEFTQLADALNSDNVQDGHTIYILDGSYNWEQSATRVYNRIQTGVDSKGNPSYTTVEDKDYTCIAAVRKGVTVMGSAPDRVMLNCGKQGGGLVVSNENAVIANLKIYNFQVVDGKTTMALNMHSGTITNCVIDNSAYKPYSVAAAPRVIWLGPGALMTDCSVQKINKVARNAWSYSTILQMHGATIRRTKFHDNYTFNAVVSAVMGDGKRPRFERCDFYDNYAYQFGGIDGSNVDIVDCTFIGASTPQGNYTEGSLNKLSGRCSLVRTVVRGTRVTSGGDPKMFQCAEGAHVSLTNCLIAKNQVQSWGTFHIGGKGTTLELYNTTVANNNTVASGKAGAITGDGTSAGRATVKLVNSVIWGNTCNGEVKNFLDSYPNTDFICTNSCFAGLTPDERSVGNTSENPMFVAEGGDWHLGAGSSCINVGCDLPEVTDDLDGKGRPIDGIGYGEMKWDAGCYEAEASGVPLEVTFFTDGEFGAAPCDATQRVVVVGSRLSGLEYEWLSIRDYAGTLSTNRQVSTSQVNVFERLGPGRYTFVSIVRNDQGDAVTNIAENAFLSAVDTCYVGLGGSELWPYDTPETATRSIRDAVEAAACRVVILQGTYAIKPEMDEGTAQYYQAVDRRGIVIEGPSDPSLAVIDCGGMGGIRLESKASFLSGVTFRNFLTTKGSGPALAVAAGTASNVVVDAGSQTGAVAQPCVYVGDVSLVTDAVIENLNGTVSGCKAASVVGGTLRRTTVRNCTATASAMITGDASSGGSRAKFEDCVFTGNTQSGSSVFSINRTDATGCRIGHNTITSKGYELVWTQESTLTDCALTNNTARGTLLVNTVWGSGGTRIKNSLVAHNDNGSWPAVFEPYTSSRMWIENCTIAWNKSASGASGGLDGVADSYDSFIDIKNTIVWGNTVGSKVIDTSAKHKTYNNRRFTYSAFAEAANYPDGNNLAVAGLKPNCRLSGLSPCRDAGTTLSWHEGGHDLDGNPRVLNPDKGGKVDLGCYESPYGRGMMVILR